MIDRRRWTLLLSVVVTCALLLWPAARDVGAQTAPAAPVGFQGRVALVIGNGEYAIDDERDLPGAQVDAVTVNTALRDIGFESHHVPDLPGQALVARITTFLGSVREGQLALVYYAGHGISVDRRAYIIPVDTQNLEEAFLRGQLIPVDDIVDAIRRQGATGVVVFDACRTRLAQSAPALRRHRGHRRSARLGGGRSLFANVGLSSGSGRSRNMAVESTSGGGLIAYSTELGALAADAADAPDTPGLTPIDHSPYAASFLRHIRDRRSLDVVLREVAGEVRNATARHPQIPWVEARGLSVEVVLNGLPAPPTPDELVSPPFAEPGGGSSSGPSSVADRRARAFEPDGGGVLFDVDQLSTGSLPAGIGEAFAALQLASPSLAGYALVPDGDQGEISYPIQRAGDFHADVAFKINHGCSAGVGRLEIDLGFEGQPDLVVALTFDRSDCVSAGGFSATASAGGRRLAQTDSPLFGGGDRSATVLRRGTEIILEAEGSRVLTIPGTFNTPLRSLGVRLGHIRREYGPHLTRVEIR